MVSKRMSRSGVSLLALGVGAGLLCSAGARAEVSWSMYGQYATSYFIPFATAPDFSQNQTNITVLASVTVNGVPSAPISFEIDTGSVGVALPAYDLPGVHVGTTQTLSYSSSGIVARGAWMPASVAYSSGTLLPDGSPPTASVPVFVVAEVTVNNQTYSCTSNDGRDAGNCFRMMGVGYGRPSNGDAPPITPAMNPLLHLQGMDMTSTTAPVRAGYVIGPDGIQAGLTSQNAGTGFAYVQLTPFLNNGVPDWQTLPGQIYVNGNPVHGQSSVLLDTGISYLWSSFGLGSGLQPVDCGPANAFKCIPDGQTMTVAFGVAGSPYEISYTYVSGQTTSELAPWFSRLNESPGEINTGIHPLAGFAYVYDAVGGYAGLQALSAAPGQATFSPSLATAGTMPLPSAFTTNLPVYVSAATTFAPADTATFSGTVSGPGTLTVDGTGTVLLSGSVTLPGLAVTSGTLTVSGTVAAPVSIAAAGTFQSTGTLTGDVTNAGTFRNAGGMTGSLTNSGGAGNIGTLTGTVVNSGTLANSGGMSGAVQNAAGARFENTGTVAGTLTNAGLLENAGTLSGTLGNSGILLSSGTVTGAVSNSGLYANAGTQAGDVSNSGLFTNARTVLGAVTNEGTLSNDGSISGNVTNAGTLIGTGTIGGSLVSSGHLSPGHSLGTVTVAGNVLLASGSVYTAEIGASGQSDHLTAGGTLEAQGATLQILPLAGTAPLLNSSYVLMTAGGGITGSFVLDPVGFGSLGSLYPFLGAQVAVSGTALDLTLVRSAVPFTALALTANQRALATAADSLPASAPLTAALAEMPGATAPAGFAALDGEIYASLLSALQTQSAYVRNAVTGRLLQAGGGPASGGPRAVDMPGLPGATLWGQAFAGWGSVDGSGNASGYTGTTGGFLMGIDTLMAGWRVGLTAGFSQSGINLDSGGSSADADTYDLALYAGRSFGPLSVRLGAAYAWQDLSTQRLISLPTFLGLETAGFAGRTAQLFGEAGWDVPVSGLGVPVALQPYAGLSYVSVETNAFTESAGAAALSGASGSFGVLSSTLGLRGAMAVEAGPIPVALTAGLGWQHAYGDLTPAASLGFVAGGTPFTVSGAPLAADSLVLSAGLAGQVGPNMSLGVSYSGQIAATASENAVKGSFVLSF